MQSILEALYYGNLCPSEKPPIPGSDTEKDQAAYYDFALQLEQSLNGKEKELFVAFCTGQPEAMRALLLRIFFRRLPSLRPDDAGGHAGRSHTDLAARLKEKQGCCERRKATVCNSPFLGRLRVSFPSLQGGTFCPGFVKFSFFK